jgi:hypothetical protein
MSYLKFDKTVMINLEESLMREVLRTNRVGAYHSSTVVDCNTRKYHGLLVMPVPALDEDNHVLLSSLDETVIQNLISVYINMVRMISARRVISIYVNILVIPYLVLCTV